MTKRFIIAGVTGTAFLIAAAACGINVDGNSNPAQIDEIDIRASAMAWRRAASIEPDHCMTRTRADQDGCLGHNPEDYAQCP
jgi:hypothetical protein